MYQKIVDQFTKQIREHGNDRYAEEHTENSGNGAADGDGKNNGNRLEAGGFSENFRADHGAVQLLDGKNQNRKNKRRFRIENQ